MKQRMRSLVAALSFEEMPPLLVRGGVRKAGQVLNRFPAKNGVPSSLSPIEIVKRKGLLDFNLKNKLWTISDGT